MRKSSSTPSMLLWPVLSLMLICFTGIGCSEQVNLGHDANVLADGDGSSDGLVDAGGDSYVAADGESCFDWDKIQDAGQDGDSGQYGEKWGLWTNGTILRGANIYQQDEGRDDGASASGWGPHLVLQDLLDLREQGANLVNYSVPGSYHVLSATPWPEMRQHLSELVQMVLDLV